MVVEWPDPSCVYLPAQAARLRHYSLLLRVAGDATEFLPALRATVASVDPAAEFDVRTMAEVRGLQIAPFRLASWSAAALGALGLTLASIGVYGVMAHLLGQRTREIGIRMALGADRWHVLWMAMREGCRLIATAIACGSVVAYAFAHVLGAMMFKVHPGDPAAFVLASASLGFVGAVAIYIPSRRATLIDPSVALRND